MAAPAAFAQITTGTISGTVRDQQGGVIPSATVVLISEARGTKSAPAMTRCDRQLHVSERDGGHLHGRSDAGRLQDGAPRRHPRQRRRPRRRAGHYAGNRRDCRDRERHGGNRDGAEPERRAVVRRRDRANRKSPDHARQLHQRRGVHAWCHHGRYDGRLRRCGRDAPRRRRPEQHHDGRHLARWTPAATARCCS